jgi:hypothetical protein
MFEAFSRMQMAAEASSVDDDGGGLKRWRRLEMMAAAA